MQVIEPRWLFDRAGITPGGTVTWGKPVPERGPGVYIITCSEARPDGQIVVYVGRTKHLSRRLGEFYRHRYGQPAPHRGGQEILNLSGLKTVHWAAVEHYAAAEHAMLEAYRALVGTLPFGNRIRSATMTAP